MHYFVFLTVYALQRVRREHTAGHRNHGHGGTIPGLEMLHVLIGVGVVSSYPRIVVLEFGYCIVVSSPHVIFRPVHSMTQSTGHAFPDDVVHAY